MFEVLAGRGLSVIPLARPSKRPAEAWSAYSSRHATAAERAAWEAAGHNIGVATGAVSDCFVLDLDGMDAWAEALTRGLPDTLVVKTPRGWHYYFQHPGHHVANRAGPRWTGGVLGWDIRGDGGYVVGPGSTYVPTPDDAAKGKLAGAYIIESASPVAPAPAWLIALLGRRHEPDGPPVPSRVAETTSAYGLAAMRAELADLQSAGDGHVNDAVNYSTFRIAQLVGGGEVREDEAHGSIMEALAAMGGIDKQEKTIGTFTRAWASGVDRPRAAAPTPTPESMFGTRDDLSSLAAATAPATNAGHPTGSWEAPDLSVLDGPEIAAPAFPRAVLRTDWAAWCEQAAIGANAPYDYAAAGLLTVAGALIGNARVAAASDSWTEPALLWVALVGGPSSGKSPALDPLANVITALEADLAKAFENTEHAYQSALRISKAHRDKWDDETRAAVNLGNEPPTKPLEAVEPSQPARPRIFLSDATMEAAADIAAGNPKGIFLYRDELAGWWRGFNRYSGGDGERQFWLQAFGARTYTVDRKKTGKPIIIPRLSIAALGGVQPDVLATMLNGEADGFAARFLFAFPEPTPGFTLATVAADIAGAGVALRRLYSLSLIDDGDSQPCPFICRLNRKAASTFETWWRARKADANSAIGLWGNWLGKQGGVALRIALILEHLWWSTPANSVDSADGFPREISEAAVEAATQLIDGWASPMALRAFGAAAASMEEADAAAFARWLRAKGMTNFNSREVRRMGNGPGGRLASAAGLKGACAALQLAGIIRQCGVRADGKPGRRPSDYEVNPKLFG